MATQDYRRLQPYDYQEVGDYDFRAGQSNDFRASGAYDYREPPVESGVNIIVGTGGGSSTVCWAVVTVNEGNAVPDAQQIVYNPVPWNLIIPSTGPSASRGMPLAGFTNAFEVPDYEPYATISQGTLTITPTSTSIQISFTAGVYMETNDVQLRTRVGSTLAAMLAATPSADAYGPSGTNVSSGDPITLTAISGLTPNTDYWVQLYCLKTPSTQFYSDPVLVRTEAA